MKRHLLLISTGLFTIAGIHVAGYLQVKSADAQDTGNLAPGDVREGIDLDVDFIPSGLAQGTDTVATSGSGADAPYMQVPVNLHTMFQVIENPPMELGAGGDQVRELQATLNVILGGRKIQLGNPIYVGLPSGSESDDLKSQVRIVYVHHRETAYQIRGDWEPSFNSVAPADLSMDNGRGYLMRTEVLTLPAQPLKVDGVYGQHTQAAVALFQLEHNLPVTGEVDKVTLDKLEPMIPTSHLLAAIMGWVTGDREEDDDGLFNSRNDNYPLLVKTCTSLITTGLILLGAFMVLHFARMAAKSTDFVSRWLLTPSSSPWFAALRKNLVFLRTAHFAPALFIYSAGRLFFPEPMPVHDRFPYLSTFQDWHDYVSHLGLAYASVVLMLVAFAFVNACDDIYNPDKGVDNPIGGITRAAKRFIGLVGAVLIWAALAEKNPLLIAGGLGGFMAVIILVFRDYLLGLVASVQIITNKVVKIGDWIAMPKYNADGDVTEISLTLIKVQNFDKTISSIPTNAVLTESFQNWTSMQSAGGRRIKRAILIDIHSVQVCTPGLVERFEQIELIRDYIERKRAELEEYNREQDVEASSVNCRQLTNIGTFRAYLEAYLRNHAGLSDEMTFLVRHLQPTNTGLPIEIYAFCKETEWAEYEAIQADIFDHVLAILPEFGLQAFQDMTDINPNLSAESLSPELLAALADIEAFVEQENRTLEDNPRYRLATRVRNVKSRIKELGLSDHLDVDGSDRTITLRHLQLS